MVDNIAFIPQKPIVPISDGQKVQGKKGQTAASNVSFGEVLNSKLDETNNVKFSGHAQ